MSNFVQIKNLSVSMCDEDTPTKKILKNFNLDIKQGEVHAIMGINGAGKSTLSKAITGHYGFEATDGEILFKGKNLLDLDPDERANEGVFMSFQSPVEIPGVNNMYFLRSALNAKRIYNGQEELSSAQVLQKVKALSKQFGIKDEMLKRSVNDGFSGGEKKKNELLQMLLLEPEFVILDEIDSGLDIDALKLVCDGINSLRNDERSFLIITHYQRLLDFVKPDFVHIMIDGAIVKTGDIGLANDLEAKGYEGIA